MVIVTGRHGKVRIRFILLSSGSNPDMALGHENVRSYTYNLSLLAVVAWRNSMLLVLNFRFESEHGTRAEMPADTHFLLN